jgi:hypothetical protein
MIYAILYLMPVSMITAFVIAGTEPEVKTEQKQEVAVEEACQQC